MRSMVTTIACVLFCADAMAQDLKSIEVIFEVLRDANGALKFVEKNPNEDVKVFSSEEDFASALVQMKGQPSTGWAVSDASGRIKDVFLADASENVPSTIISKIAVGESVTKVNIASIGGVSFPSEEEIDQLFRQSVETIIERMCILPSNRRPTDMTTSFTVGVSVVMQASILVSARWDTANVCL